MFLRDLITRLGGTALGEVASPLSGVATLEDATSSHITFLANPRYRGKLGTTRAGAVILGSDDRDATNVPRIVAANPYAYFARVAQLFSPHQTYRAGIHPSAVVGPGARISPSASVAEFASIGASAVIGDGARIGPGSAIGSGVAIGAGTRIEARATVYDGCHIGERCIIHSGAVIGADGFGFAPDAGAWIKIPQTGRVVVGDDVEVGANTTIDRGALSDTVIGSGVKIDNQVQIGHNVIVGDHTAIAGCVGIAGSAVIGKRCQLGGAAMILGHLKIADDCTISPGTMITRSIAVPGTYTSIMPFLPHREWLRNAAQLRHLADIADVARKPKKGDKS